MQIYSYPLILCIFLITTKIEIARKTLYLFLLFLIITGDSMLTKKVDESSNQYHSTPPEHFQHNGKYFKMEIRNRQVIKFEMIMCIFGVQRTTYTRNTQSEIFEGQ